MWWGDGCAAPWSGVAGVEFLSPTGRQTPEDNQIYSPGTLTVTVSQQ